MPVSPDFVEFVLEQLEPLGHPSSNRMFGGVGVYIDGFIISIIVNDQIYLKVDDETRATFEDEGLEPFSYQKKAGEVGVMSYYTAPESALDDGDDLCKWARLALDASLRSAKKKKPKKKS